MYENISNIELPGNKLYFALGLSKAKLLSTESLKLFKKRGKSTAHTRILFSCA